MLIVSFGFVIYRMPELRSRARLDSWLSREGAFLANNWILLFAAFFMLFATMFPTLSEALFHERITVSAPFFNLWMVPIGLTLLFLTGVGPLMAWRKATPSNLRFQFTTPLIAMAVVIIVCFAFGLHKRPSTPTSACRRPRRDGAGAARAGDELPAARVRHRQQEVRTDHLLRPVWVRARVDHAGVLARHRDPQAQHRTGRGVGLIGMVLRGKRRYGGYLVHLGIMLMFIGWAGSAYQKEKTARLGPGQPPTISGYTVRFDKLAHEEDRQKEMVTGELTALVGGKEIDRPRPAKWFFHNHESEPTTEVAIKRAPAEDLYITLGGYDLAEGTATLKMVINPMVDWIWFGFMLLAIATGIVLVPDSVLERLTAGATATAGAAARSAAGAAGIALWIALGAGGLVLLAPHPAAAQMARRRNRGARTGRTGRELAGAQHRLPVRHLPAQSDRMRVGRLRPRDPGSVDDPAAAESGAEARGGRRILHHEVRGPGGAGGAARSRIQPPGVAVPVQRRGARGRRPGLRRVPDGEAPARALLRRRSKRLGPGTGRQAG